MAIKGAGYFTLDNNINGILTIIGTDEVQFANVIAEAPSGRCYVTGSLLNLTPQAYQLKIIGVDKEASTFTIPAFAGVKFTKMPLRQLLVAVNGTIRLTALGFVVDPLVEDDPIAIGMLNTNSGLFIELDAGRSHIYDVETHTDIVTATTTTVLDPANGFTGRIYKITLSAQGVCRLTIETTDSDGSGNPHILGIVNFAGEGTFVYDFGDNGKSITNGVNGLLRIISNNTAVVDIDIISRAD